MNTAFSVAYPSQRSVLGRVFLPLVEPRSYLRALHFLVMFPLGIAYFVFFVTAFAFGGAMIWTFVGPPVLLLALFVSLYIGDVEAWLVNLTTREGIKRPPKVMEGVTSLREKVWTRLIDPSTWTGVLYEVMQFPVGIAAFVVAVVGFSVAVSLIAAPVIVWQDPSWIDLKDGPLHLTIDKPLEALPLVPLGLIVWFITMHVITVLSSLHAMWARLMLGTRSRRSLGAGLPAAPAPVTPDPPPETPVALLPPVEPPLIAQPSPSVTVEPSTGPGGDAVFSFDGAHPALAELTSREQEVLSLVARGYSNADICEALFISEGTVKTHVRHILAKLGLYDRTQVIVFAYEHGLVVPSARPMEAIVATREA